ncbi:MAG: tyrosine-type recombinase/integrase [Lachnospiraceae bacterium]|nr:tyrosine-type recombinase/integrase [Lachnospiraceae bacterium]
MYFRITLIRQLKLSYQPHRFPLNWDFPVTVRKIFVNKRKNKLSDQSVRFMIKRYAEVAGITQHITPHIFQYSFAALLLEQDVEIRYIRQMLGHSSISTTKIYTHVSSKKQKDILINFTANPKVLFLLYQMVLI